MTEEKLKEIFERGNVTCKTLIRPIAHSIMPKSTPEEAIHYLNHTMMLHDGWVGDKSEPDNEVGLIFLRFKPRELASWEERYEKYLKVAPTFVRRYRKDGYKIIVYRFPEEWMSDYMHIMNSEYSKVSSEYIQKFYPGDTFLKHVNKKTKEIKEHYGKKFNVPLSVFDDCEIGEPFVIDKEYL